MARRRKAEWLRVADDLRRQFRGRGEFTQQDYRQALHSALRECWNETEAYDGFVDHVAEQVDKASRREPDPDQPDLPGIRWDLDGELHLGAGRRVDKRLAQADHAQEALALDDANLIAVQQANLRKRQEWLALQPYWGGGVTKQEAVSAYEADHNQAAS